MLNKLKSYALLIVSGFAAFSYVLAKVMSSKKAKVQAELDRANRSIVVIESTQQKLADISAAQAKARNENKQAQDERNAKPAQDRRNGRFGTADRLRK